MAQQYVRPDEAAIVVVGDGAEVIEQIKPYADAIELYNTAGKRKEGQSASFSEGSEETDSRNLVGTWTLEIETPLGQNIPATLTLWPR